MNKYQIREARDKDLDNFLALLRHLHRSENIPDADSRMKTIWQELIEDKRVTCFVAESSRELIGSVTIDIIPNLTRGARPFGVVQNVVTHSEYRGQGIGTALMQHVMDYSKQKNCYQVLVQTGRSEVVSWYEGLGFRQDKIGLVVKPEWVEN